MSSQAARIYNYYNAQCGLGPEYFIPYLQGEVCPQKKIELYYRLTISPENSDPNRSFTDFLTDPSGTGIFRGISNRFMVNNDFITYNKNILSFVGYRTPRNTSLPLNLQVPDIYNETINISLPGANNDYSQDYIQGVANYLDEGTGFETQVSKVDYVVSAASGIFSGYKIIRINFFNNGDPPGFSGLGPVRIVEILK
jgi:hypothetical protein